MNLFFLAKTAHHHEEAHKALHDAAHAIADHGAHAEHADHGAPHIVNWVGLLAKATHGPISDFLHNYETAIFSAIVVFLIAIVSIKVAKNMKRVPGKGQLMVEQLVQGLDGLVCGVLGSHGRAYTPFVGSLFIYIMVTNLYGLIPLQNSSTAYITTTAPLAICVFFYVQWIGLTKNGLWGYIYHLMGSPKDFFGYLMIPLNFPLHILGEFSKPISLMFRLYGNVMAGHILVAVFLGLGLDMLKGLHVPFGVPLHFPFLFLEIIVGIIQAFVFALLSTVYITMMLPHDDHEEHHAEAHA